MSDCVGPHGSQYARLLGPSLSPRACSNSCPLGWWCHPTISSSVAPSSVALSLSQHQGHFQWVGSSHQWPKYRSFTFSVSPSNEYLGWFHLVLTGLMSLLPKGLSRVFPTLQFQSISSLVLSLHYGPILTCVHHYWENHNFDCKDLVDKVMFLLFNTLSRFIIAFLPRSKCLLISWLQLPSTVILDLSEVVGGRRKSVIACTFSPSICPWSDATRFHELHLLNVKF